MNNQILYGRRRGPVALPAPPPPRDRASRLESYRPLVLASGGVGLVLAVASGGGADTAV